LNKNLLVSLIMVLLFLAFGSFGLGATETDLPPAKGGKLPVINLQIPKDRVQRIYLGLTGNGYFRIPQIKADAIIINIFNLYCPICQSTASAMTEIYHWIEDNPIIKDKIKLIGIGVGNSLLELEVFKRNNDIPFPVFPDENFEIHQALGEVRTPFFIAIKLEKDGSHEIVHTHLGGLTDPRAFLDLMVEAYGMKREDLLIKEAASSPR
jgi:hypothetical protein